MQIVAILCCLGDRDKGEKSLYKYRCKIQQLVESMDVEPEDQVHTPTHMRTHEDMQLAVNMVHARASSKEFQDL